MSTGCRSRSEVSGLVRRMKNDGKTEAEYYTMKKNHMIGVLVTMTLVFMPPMEGILHTLRV